MYSRLVTQKAFRHDGRPELPQVHALAKHSTFKSAKGGAPLGPFCSSQEAALVETHLRIIAAGEIGTAEDAVDVFLAHRFRLDILNKVWEQAASEGKDSERFFLKHADNKGD